MAFETDLIRMSNPEDECDLCVRNVIALKSALETVKKLDKDISSIELELEETGYCGEIGAISYGNEDNVGFRLVTIDKEVISNNLDRDIRTELNRDWCFKIDPEKLDIAQNKTGSIVNMNETGCYLKKGSSGAAMVVLTSRKSKNSNSVSIPISETSTGNLHGEIAIHESAFRLMNVIRAKELVAAFDATNNALVVKCALEKDGFYVKSRMLSGLVNGK